MAASIEVQEEDEDGKEKDEDYANVTKRAQRKRPRKIRPGKR